MKAMIFAAGLGTRLRPLTDNMPKALVQLHGEPMLKHVITHIAEAGFDDITINVHHFAPLIVDYLKRNKNFGLNIHISDESDLLLDTAGGIRKARPFLDGEEPFLVHNSDILTDLDLRQFYNAHLESRADVSLLATKRKTSRYFVFDNQYYLKGWINHQTREVKPKGFAYHPQPADTSKEGYHELAFGGIHVISPTIFNYLADKKWEGKVSIVPFYLDTCNKLKIKAYRPASDFRWFDIGKLDALRQAEVFFK